MLKKFFIVALCLFSFTVYAQEKFGHVNTMELFGAMPEKIAAEGQLDKLSKQYESDLANMQQEYQKKYNDFIAAQDTLPENIKVRRMTEIQELMQRIENWQQGAYQDIQKKSQELQAPIAEKMRKAIQAVGEENGLIYIYDASNPAFLYISSKSIDVMSMVKKKLGIN